MQQLFLRGLAATISTTSMLTLPCSALGGEDWSNFDRDLEALSVASLTNYAGAPTVHGLIRGNWATLPNGREVTPATMTTPAVREDHNGFLLDDAQVSMEGQVGEQVGYRVELEAAGGTAVVLDAYGTWDACKYTRITMGRFRSPLLFESQLHDGDLLFILRTESGQLFNLRNEGAMLSGALGQVRWAASIQNGLDALQGDAAFSARVSLDAMGGGVGPHQGAYGAGSQAKFTLGAGYFDDPSEGNGKDGDVLAADAQLQVGRFAADAMIAKYQQFADPLFKDQSESQPWNVTASFMVIEERLEAAARWQETHNTMNNKDVTVGLNYYLEGHDVKFQANASYVFSDDDAFDDTIRYGIGANVRV